MPAALARKLRLHDYFALAFGTMIGTGWLVLMDDWLGRGGPLGAALGFAIGGIILLPSAMSTANGSSAYPTPPAKLPTPPKFFRPSSATSPAG